MSLARSFGALGAMVLLVAVTACAPAAPPSPTAAPPKPATAASPATGSAAPVASPAAKPAASPAASPVAAAAGISADAAPQSVAKPADFPSKPIEIVVPFAAGGGYDVVARQLAGPLQKTLGQPVVIKNVVGGGQRIGARTFQQSPADGHTLGYFADSTLYPATLVEPPEGFDLNTWVWAAGIRKSPVYIGVGKDSPIKTIQDLLDADKSGKRLRFGHGGIGNFLPTQVAFVETIGIKNAAYVGGFTGTADMAPALVRGDLDVEVLSPISSTVQFVQSGDIRPILLLEPTRNALLPNTPTAREVGLSNLTELEAIGGFTSGIAVPPGTPADRVKFLEFAVLSAIRDPEFVQWAKSAGVEPDLLALLGEEIKARKVSEYQLYTRYADALKKAAGS
ncbi:MAG: Bug family tripartite tricarboxylate transporter substrate binding protein [Chloroflexota bacterium]